MNQAVFALLFCSLIKFIRYVYVFLSKKGTIFCRYFVTNDEYCTYLAYLD